MERNRTNICYKSVNKPVSVRQPRQQFSKCASLTEAPVSPGNLLEIQILGRAPDLLNQKFWG